MFHVLVVNNTDTVTTVGPDGQSLAAVSALIAALPEHAWRRCSAGKGSPWRAGL